MNCHVWPAPTNDEMISRRSAETFSCSPVGAEKKAVPILPGRPFRIVRFLQFVYFVGGLSIQTMPMEARHMTPEIMKEVE